MLSFAFSSREGCAAGRTALVVRAAKKDDVEYGADWCGHLMPTRPSDDRMTTIKGLPVQLRKPVC